MRFIRKNIISDNYGISLVEILIALSVASIAFFPIMNVMRTGLKTNLVQSNYVQASELAQNCMDEILSLHYPDVKIGKNNITYNSITYPRTISKKRVKFKIDAEIKLISPQFTFRRKNLIGDITPPLNKPAEKYVAKDELKEINISVHWKGVSKVVEFKLRSYKASLYE